MGYLKVYSELLIDYIYIHNTLPIESLKNNVEIWVVAIDTTYKV